MSLKTCHNPAKSIAQSLNHWFEGWHVWVLLSKLWQVVFFGTACLVALYDLWITQRLRAFVWQWTGSVAVQTPSQRMSTGQGRKLLRRPKLLPDVRPTPRKIYKKRLRPDLLRDLLRACGGDDYETDRAGRARTPSKRAGTCNTHYSLLFIIQCQTGNCFFVVKFRLYSLLCMIRISVAASLLT